MNRITLVALSVFDLLKKKIEFIRVNYTKQVALYIFNSLERFFLIFLKEPVH